MEIHYLPVVGLALIAIGWLIQYAALRAGKKGMERNFVLIYSLGVLFLVLDGYQSGLYDLAAMNVVTLACGLLVLSGLKN